MFSADRQVVAERQLLVNQRHAAPPRLERRGRRIGAALDRHRSGIGGDRSGEHVHQRALAGAVLADERVHLSRPDADEIDAVEGHRGPEALANAGERQHVTQ